MSRFSVQFCIVPGNWWGADSPQPEFAQMAGEALAIERRLPKGVDVERERSRHAICARRIEQIVRSACLFPRESAQYSQIVLSGQPVAGRLEDNYLVLIDKMTAAVNENLAWQAYRIGASFFPPSDPNEPFSLAQHIRGFEHLARLLKLDQDPQIKQRLSLLRWADQQKCGVVEAIEIYPADLQQGSGPVVHTQTSIRLDDLIEKKSLGDGWISIDPDHPLDDQQRRSQREIMIAEVERALRGNGVANINNYSHLVITDVLHDFVFTQAVTTPRPLKVVYEDGSQGHPFPLFSLPQPGPEIAQRFAAVLPLRVAMLSIRHMEMDREVDMAWFRNTEASLRRSCYADTDFFCYQETLRQLKTLGAQEPILIHLYQTGLEPAVVGFYRALVEYYLIKDSNKAQVAVIPRYFRGLGVEYRSGSLWANR